MAISDTKMKWILWFLIAIVCLAIVAVIAHISRPPELKAGVLFGYVNSTDAQPVRFYWTDDNGAAGIIYAPYGYTPLKFTDVQIEDRRIEFTWPDTPAWNCGLDFQRWHRIWQGHCQRPDGSERFVQLGLREKADLGQRRLATRDDVKILEYALATLPDDEASWNRADDRICDRAPLEDRWTLYCALHRASLEVTGEYVHWRPALQMVRRKIMLSAHDRMDHHILMDYNNHPDTTMAEIRARIDESIQALNYQLEGKTRLERVRIPFELKEG